MEEGAPELGLDLRECGDVTMEQITLKEQGARTQGGGARTPQSFGKMGPFEKPALATIAKNEGGGNTQTAPTVIENLMQIELMGNLADRNEVPQDYDGVKPHTFHGNKKDDAPKAVDGGNTKDGEELLGIEELMELLNEEMGDKLEKDRPHEIDGNIGGKKMAPFLIRKYDCVVKKKFCETHGKVASKFTYSKRCWTRNVKTGLFGNRIRKVSGWRCSGGVALTFNSVT